VVGPVKAKPEGKEEARENDEKEDEDAMRKVADRYLIAEPMLLLPIVNEKSTDEQLMVALDAISIRIANAVSAIFEILKPQSSTYESSLELQLQAALASRGGLNERTLEILLNALESSSQ